MNREELDKELDGWLDQAAAEYGRAETQPGLETRLIADLNSRLEPKKWRFRWMPMAATAAVLILLVCILFTRFQQHPTTETASGRPGEILRPLQQSLQQIPPPKTIAAESLTERNAPPHARPKSRASKERHFLSGRLTDQERHLIAFAQAVSKQATTVVPEITEMGPLQIPDLEIPTLQIPEPEIPSIEIEAFKISTFHRSEEQL